jgi:hypothetical protein
VSVEGLAMTPATRSRSGFCVIRVEAEQHGLLIVVILNPDRHQVSTLRTPRKLRDVEEAVQIVREFLQEFAAEDTKRIE